MRFAILFIFCTLTLTASAQFWKKKKPEPIRYDLLPQPQGVFSIAISDANFNGPAVGVVALKRSIFDIEAAEDAILKEAKHNMRFRIYDAASYNFSALAQLYILQNRFSEAKWYLLQSNAISREQNDDKHTISNLLGLAAIKLAIGEPILAKADLQEAHDIAGLKGYTTDVTIIEQRMHDLQFNKPSALKVELRYAEAVEAGNKSQ